MMRLSAFFVAVCMVLIAGSFGAALFFVFGLSAAESSMIAVTGITALALYNAVSGGQRDRTEVGTQIADLSRGTSDIARQVAELGRRLATAEIKVATAVDMAVAAAKPSAPKSEKSGNLSGSPPGPVPFMTSPPAVPRCSGPPRPRARCLRPGRSALNLSRSSTPTTKILRRSRRLRPHTAAARCIKRPLQGMEHDAVLAMIRTAVEANRLDLICNPSSRCRSARCATTRRDAAADRRRRSRRARRLPPYAEAAGLMPQIDHLMLFRCVQVARRLLTKTARLECSATSPRRP